MSSMTDLDRLIATWLGDGPTAAPEDVVERAVATTERVRQRRARGAEVRLASVHFTLDPLAWAALAIAFVVMTTAIGIGTGVIPLPIPDRGADRTPSQTTEPAAELETFEGVDGSFRIELPSDWDNDSGPIASTTYLRRDAVRLSVRGADPAGEILTCDEPAGPWETCDLVTAATLDQLAAAIGLTSTSEEGVAPLGPSRTTSEVDDEPARLEHIEAYEYPARGAEFVTYVAVVHDGRPYLLRFWTPGDAGLGYAVGEVLAGFSFLDPESDATRSPRPTLPPTDDASPDGVAYAAPDGTFEITVTDGWKESAGPDPAALYLTGAGIRVSIRGGDAEGQIRLCDAPAGAWESCPMVSASTLAELADTIELDGSRTTVWVGPVPFDSELDDELAVTTYLTGGTSPPTTVRYVVAMHGGRPFVIRAAQQPSRGTLDELADLLRGFRFIDATPTEPAGASPNTYTLTIPDGWIEAETTLPGVRTYRIVVGDREWPGMNVSIESDDGVLDLCVIRCASFTGIDTIDDIAAAIRDETVLGEPVETPYGPYQPRPTWWFDRDVTTLDGEVAQIERPVISTTLPGEGQFEHVFAVHDGRAVVFSFDFRSVWVGRISDETIAEILESFEFVD